MSSASIAATILHASQTYALSIYLLILVSGCIGNMYSIIIFNWLKLFRQNQCAYYLIVVSIVDLVLILIVVPLRISELAFNYDPTRLSLAWCKIRQAVVASFSLMSFSTVCFAAIDQYLCTHHVPWIRQFSTIKLARRLVFVAIIVLALHSIPFFIFFELSSINGCVVYNIGFSRYYSFIHFCTLSGILPITISASFAGLAYLNVRRIVRHQIPLVRRRLDRQLTAMILTKVAFLVGTTLPFVLFRIYGLNRPPINPQDFVQSATEQLVFSITSSLFYMNSAVSATILLNDIFFYLYFIIGHFLCILVRFQTISSTSQACTCQMYLENFL